VGDFKGVHQATQPPPQPRYPKSMPIPDNRCIGTSLICRPHRRLFRRGPTRTPRDWAVVEIRKDAFGDDFKGNILYIGTSPVLLITTPVAYLDFITQATSLDEANFPRPHVYPHVADREGLRIPEARPCSASRGVVPLDEIHHPKHLDAKGDPRHGGGQERGGLHAPLLVG